MRKIALALISLILLLLLSVPASAAEGNGGISASSSVQVQFPTSMTFGLEAASPADITRIFLRYSVDRVTTVDVTTVVQVDFEPSRVVDVEWTWDMRKTGSLPPGAMIHYSWRIEDASGLEVETLWDTAAFDDDRHDWRSLSADDVTLFWYEGEQAFALALLDSARGALDRLAKDTGASLAQRVRVYVYAGSSDLQNAILFSQEWAGGLAFPDYGAVAIGVEPSNLGWGENVIAHEIAHLLTYQMTSNPYGGIPTWLNEGLSVYAEGKLRPDLVGALDSAVSDDNLISVQALASNFPTDVNEARLSYAESYSVVEFLISSFGRESMLQLLNVFKQGSTYDGALLLVYGFDVWGLDQAWRATLGLAPRESPSTTVQSTPTPSDGKGVCGCQAAEADAGGGAFAVVCLVGLLVLPGAGEVVRRLTRTGEK